MEVSENSQGGNILKESPDGSGKVEVDVEDGVDFIEVIELPPEPGVSNKDNPVEWAVEVIQDGKKVQEENVEDSRSSDVTAQERGKEAESSSLFPGIVSELPVSVANNVEASSGLIAAVKKEPDAGEEIGVPEVSEIPRNTEDDQTYTTLSHQTRASWFNCCGLLDAFKGSNQ